MNITASKALVYMSFGTFTFALIMGSLKLNHELQSKYINLPPGENADIDLFVLIFFPAMMLISACFALACWSGCSVVLSPTSISKRNFFGKKRIILWDDVTKVLDYTPTYDEALKSEGKVYVYAGDKAIKIHNTIIKGEIAVMQKMVAMKTPPNAVVEPESSDIYRMHREYHGEKIA